MNVIHIVDSFSPIGGGSQTSVLLWLKELTHHDNIDLRVISNTSPVHFPINNDQHWQLPTLTVPWLFGPLSVSWLVPQKTHHLLLDFHPDIIHLHDPMLLSPFFIHLAKQHHIPIVSTFHTNFPWCADYFSPPAKWSMQLVAMMQRYVFKHSTALTTPSKYWQQYYADVLHKPVYEVPYPVDASFFDYRPTVLSDNHHIRLITTSRLAPEKKIDVLITMMQYLDNRFSLTIVGDGPERPHLEKLVKDLRLNERVTFTGWRSQSEQVELYHQHHLFVLASNFETFGLTYIESLATGTPGLVFDYPVSREVIPPGTARFMHSLDPHLWAEQITDMFNNDEYPHMIRSIDRSRKQFDRYTLTESTQALIDVYHQL